MNDEITIGEISKNENDVLRISVKEYKGHRYVDIRMYFRNGRGNMFPDKMGVTIGKKHIDDFIIFLKGARQALDGQEEAF